MHYIDSSNSSQNRSVFGRFCECFDSDMSGDRSAIGRQLHTDGSLTAKLLSPFICSFLKSVVKCNDSRWICIFMSHLTCLIPFLILKIFSDRTTERIFLPARRYASAGLCDSDVSVCLSVCHTPVLCLAERKQDREMYTI